MYRGWYVTKTVAPLFIAVLVSGCCIDAERNTELGNIITYKGNKVCVDSTQRGLAASAKICGRPCAKEE